MLPRYCRECTVLSICNGECPKNRFRKTPDGDPGLNYLCAGYKAFFKHADQPMRIMAELIRANRPASEVMAIVVGSREISRQSLQAQGEMISVRAGVE